MSTCDFVLKDVFSVGQGGHGGLAPGLGLRAVRDLVLLRKVHCQVLSCSWGFGNEEWHTGGKPVSRGAGWRNGPFIHASDSIMVKFIKVIASLKSHQEKQIWTHEQAHSENCAQQHKKGPPVLKQRDSSIVTCADRVGSSQVRFAVPDTARGWRWCQVRLPPAAPGHAWALLAPGPSEEQACGGCLGHVPTWPVMQA